VLMGCKLHKYHLFYIWFLLNRRITPAVWGRGASYHYYKINVSRESLANYVESHQI